MAALQYIIANKIMQFDMVLQVKGIGKLQCLEIN